MVKMHTWPNITKQEKVAINNLQMKLWYSQGNACDQGNATRFKKSQNQDMPTYMYSVHQLKNPTPTMERRLNK